MKATKEHSREFLSNIAHYICEITDVYDGSDWPPSIGYCPFTTFDEAIDAYLLHIQRLENRNYSTISERWERKYNRLLRDKGYPRIKRRRRKTSHIH